MNPTDLPHFAIESVGSDRCIGQFDARPEVREGHLGCLYLGSGRFLWGRFREVNVASCTASFVPKQGSEITAVQPGNTYPYLDGWAGERAELILNEDRQWRKTKFEPRDMVLTPLPNGGSIGEPLSPDAPAGGKIVPGGWDHEHCHICMETISVASGTPTGYVSDNRWVCEECYTKYVQPKSLAFLQ